MEEIPEGMLNFLEMVVRCYDCCLSCSAFMTVVQEDDDGSRVLVRKEFQLGLA